MAKIQYILFLILFITVVNLFYKRWFSESVTMPLFLIPGVKAFLTSTCPMYGMKCPTDEVCDCVELCGNGDYVPFRVMEEDDIYLNDQQLVPGTYCLPKGIGNCNQKTSYHVFSTGSWNCVPKNASVARACRNDEAANHDQNVLWDYLKQTPAVDVENAYDRLGDGSLRYRCQCNSLDLVGNKMISTVPFVCSVDYCVKHIPNPLPMMRFKDGVCECGPYLHETALDDTSPCVLERSRLENHTLIGRVDCTASFSWNKSPFYCPNEEGSLRFETKAWGGKLVLDYVKLEMEA